MRREVWGVCRAWKWGSFKPTFADFKQDLYVVILAAKGEKVSDLL